MWKCTHVMKNANTKRTKKRILWNMNWFQVTALEENLSPFISTNMRNEQIKRIQGDQFNAQDMKMSSSVRFQKVYKHKKKQMHSKTLVSVDSFIFWTWKIFVSWSQSIISMWIIILFEIKLNHSHCFGKHSNSRNISIVHFHWKFVKQISSQVQLTCLKWQENLLYEWNANWIARYCCRFSYNDRNTQHTHTKTVSTNRKRTIPL